MSGSAGAEVVPGSRPVRCGRSRPDVSIIVPCYDAAETVSDTIASIQAQTCENWEAICVDDASTDRTPQLLDALAASDPRMRCLRVPHGGLGATRNRGLPHARAERVFFLDADDVLRPEALAVLLEASQAVGAGVIVSAGYELLDHQGRPLSILHFPAVREFSVAAFLRGNRIPPMTLVPTPVLGSRPFDETLPACEDWDLWLRLAHAGVGCVTVPRVLFGYRLRAGSLSRNADRMYASARRVLERWAPLAPEPDATPDAMHRLACTYGAVALASGAPQTIWRYFDDLPPLEPTEGFCLDVANSLHWAFTFVHGAGGETWRGHVHEWLAEIEAWLPQSPLAAHADAIRACLARVASDPLDRLAAVRDFMSRRSAARRLLIYGLGANGLTLLEQLRSAAGLPTVELSAADDNAGPFTFTTLDLPRDDPRHWRRWPAGTIVVVTPNDCEAMRQTLVNAGGCEGTDFIALARRAAATVAAAK